MLQFFSRRECIGRLVNSGSCHLQYFCKWLNFCACVHLFWISPELFRGTKSSALRWNLLVSHSSNQGLAHWTICAEKLQRHTEPLPQGAGLREIAALLPHILCYFSDCWWVRQRSLTRLHPLYDNVGSLIIIYNWGLHAYSVKGPILCKS